MKCAKKLKLSKGLRTTIVSAGTVGAIVAGVGVYRAVSNKLAQERRMKEIESRFLLSEAEFDGRTQDGMYGVYVKVSTRLDGTTGVFINMYSSDDQIELSQLLAEDRDGNGIFDSLSLRHGKETKMRNFDLTNGLIDPLSSDEVHLAERMLYHALKTIRTEDHRRYKNNSD